MSGVVATLFALAALIAGGLALTRRNVVHAAVLVMAALLLIAGAMLALSAGLAAALMILVHAGTIVAVLLFVALTTPAASGRDSAPLGLVRAGLLLVPLVLLMVMALLALPPGAAQPVPPVSAVGQRLFGPWAVGVELASLLLLVALMGARQLLRPAAGQGEAGEPGEKP